MTIDLQKPLVSDFLFLQKLIFVSHFKPMFYNIIVKTEITLFFHKTTKEKNPRDRKKIVKTFSGNMYH